MNAIEASFLAGVACLLLSGCGSENHVQGANEDGFTLVNGELLKTCQVDGKFIYTPEDASHLEGCQLVKGVLYLQPNNEHVSLESYHLEDIQQIDGELHISDSTSLQNLNGLDDLQRLNGRLFILYNEKLEDISALAGLKGARDALINSNPALKRIALPKFGVLESEMQIYFNESLESIEFASLEKVGSLSISSNYELTRVDFPSLEKVDEVIVAANNKLNDFAQLASFME